MQSGETGAIIINPSNTTTILNAATCASSLNISGNSLLNGTSIFNNATTHLNILNISGATVLNSSLNLSQTITTGNALRISGGPSAGTTNALSIGGYGMISVDAPGVFTIFFYFLFFICYFS